MSKFSLDKEMSIAVKATFIAKGSDTPVTGEDYILRLYDTDVFGDDYIGQSSLDETGQGNILCTKTYGNPLTQDILPDFYFVLYKNKVPVFQSKVMEDLNPEVLENYRPGEGEVINLGTFLVDA